MLKIFKYFLQYESVQESCEVIAVDKTERQLATHNSKGICCIQTISTSPTWDTDLRLNSISFFDTNKTSSLKPVSVLYDFGVMLNLGVKKLKQNNPPK